MGIPTPRDAFETPAILGNYRGTAVPVRVMEDGSVAVAVKDADGGSASATVKQRLALVRRLDLSVAREKESLRVEMDSFAVTDLKGSFFMFIGGSDESKKCTINKCLSVDVSAGEIFISNAAQNGGYAEIWFFTSEEDA